MSKTIDRRSFLGTAGAAATAMMPSWLPAVCSAAGETNSSVANNRPHIGAIGVGDRGLADLQEAVQFGDLVAVCDVDANRAAAAQAAHGGKAKVYSDFRRLLERQDIDVILNATPDHWHTAINIAACRAGKDVYAEKPLTLTIEEGKILRQVVEETGRIVQVGTQQRSEKPFQTAVELVRNGRVGTLKQVWVALPYFSTGGGPFASQQVPEFLNWDMYQGQASVHDYCPQRTHGNFRWWYEYAGGIITDWGNHHLDIAHWGMDCELSGPTTIEARGLFPNPPGPEYYNTPDRFFARMKYANGVELLYFTSLNERLKYGDVSSHQATTPEQAAQLFGEDVPEEIKAYDRNGIMFIGDRGRVFVNRGGVYGKPVEELEENPLPEGAWRVPETGSHMQNFFDCVKSRREPVSPVRIQHRTITACHLTNMALRLNRALKWDPVSEQIVDDSEANALQRRERRKPYDVLA